MKENLLRTKLITENFLQIRKKMDEISTSPSFPPRLVAVSKTYSPHDIRILYDLGQRDFGENRINELKEKAENFKSWGIKDIQWHFMGKIQSNKIKTLLLIPGLKYLHSVDSLPCLKNLLKAAANLSLGSVDPIGLFLQVNTSLEEEKQGFKTLEEMREILDYWVYVNALGQRGQEAFKLQGMMTMGKIRTENLLLEAKKSFTQLREWKQILEKEFPLMPLQLSMGMSQDFAVAINLGTDWVRIGSSIFGPR